MIASQMNIVNQILRNSGLFKHKAMPPHLAFGFSFFNIYKNAIFYNCIYKHTYN